MKYTLYYEETGYHYCIRETRFLCHLQKVAINRNAKTVFKFQLDAIVCWRLGT